MLKLQLAANAIAKNGLQIKPQPVKGSSINTTLIFSMAVYQGAGCYITGLKQIQNIIKIQDLTNKSRVGASLLHTRGMWSVCQLVREKKEYKKKINYRKEEVGDCGCIYG